MSEQYKTLTLRLATENSSFFYSKNSPLCSEQALSVCGLSMRSRVGARSGVYAFLPYCLQTAEYIACISAAPQAASRATHDAGLVATIGSARSRRLGSRGAGAPERGAGAGGGEPRRSPHPGPSVHMAPGTRQSVSRNLTCDERDREEGSKMEMVPYTHQQDRHILHISQTRSPVCMANGCSGHISTTTYALRAGA